MVFLAALQLPWRRVAGLLFFGLSCVVCVCGARFDVLCTFLGLVLVAAVAMCVLCARGRVCSVLVVRLGACPRLSGLVMAAQCGRGAVCRGCSPALAVGPGCGSPPPPLCAPPPLSLCRVAWGAVPLVPCPGLPGLWWVCRGAGWGGGEGSLTLARVPSLVVSPRGGRCLHSPSGCNSVVRAIHLHPLGTNGPCSVARYCSCSPHRGRVHCRSQGSPCGTGVSLACPHGRCALPAAPLWARTAVRAVGRSGGAHWSLHQAGATAGR